MAGESEYGAAAPINHLKSPEIQSSGLNIIRLNVDPKLESNPDLMWKVINIQAAVGAVNAFESYFGIYDKDSRERTSSSKLQTLQNENSKLGNFNNLFTAINLTKFAGRNEDLGVLLAMQHLNAVPGNVFGRETTEDPTIAGQTKYPPGTTFTDINADSAEIIESLAENAGTLIHDFGNAFGGYRGRVQIVQRKVAKNVQKRLGHPSGEISDDDVNNEDLLLIDSEYKKIMGFMKSEAPELLGDLYPKENLSGLTFKEAIDASLKRNLTTGHVEDIVLILDATSKSWLQQLADKARAHIIDIDLNNFKEIRMDEGDKLITGEIETLLAAHDEAVQKGLPELAVPISPLILDQMKVIYSAAKLRRLVGNSRQNSEKSFEAKMLKKEAEQDSSSDNGGSLDEDNTMSPIIRITEGGNRIIFGIADNGLGLPLGFKIEKGNTTWANLGVNRGSGIGLASQAAEAEHPNYNGKIDLKNNLGGGAILTLDLPLKPLNDPS